MASRLLGLGSCLNARECERLAYNTLVGSMVLDCVAPSTTKFKLQPMQNLTPAACPTLNLFFAAGLAASSLLLATARPAQAGPAVFFKTVDTTAGSIAECEARAAGALERVVGSSRLGVEKLAFFGVTADTAEPVTASIACTAVEDSVVATVVTAGDLSFDEVKALRDRLLQALLASG